MLACRCFSGLRVRLVWPVFLRLARGGIRSDSPDRVQRGKRSRRPCSARLGCLLLPQPKNRLPGSQRLPYHQKPTLRLGRRKRQRMPGKTSPSSGLQIQLPQASGKRREFDLKEGKFVCNLNYENRGFEPEIRFSVLPSTQSESTSRLTP
jgi:hypothetical protein